MPVFLRFLSSKSLLRLVILAAIVTTLLLSGVLPWFHSGRSTHAFDDSLLADEPLQISDVRSTLDTANRALARSDWGMTLRLVRDARNQWQAFIPQMHASYQTYNWAQADIERATETWTYAIDQVKYRNATGVRRSLATLKGIIDKYRLPVKD